MAIVESVKIGGIKKLEVEAKGAKSKKKLSTTTRKESF
jgi:hypothetical protein